MSGDKSFLTMEYFRTSKDIWLDKHQLIEWSGNNGKKASVSRYWSFQKQFRILPKSSMWVRACISVHLGIDKPTENTLPIVKKTENN